MKPLKKFLFIAVTLIFLSGCGTQIIPSSALPEKTNSNFNSQNVKEEKNSYTYSDFSFNYPKEWGNVEILHAGPGGKAQSLSFSAGKNSNGENFLPSLIVFPSNYKISPPFPGEEKTTEVDYIHIDLKKSEKEIAAKILTPIVRQAIVKKITLANKKVLFIKTNSYYWGQYLEYIDYVFPKYNNSRSTLVISGTPSQKNEVEELISSLSLDSQNLFQENSSVQGYADNDLGLKFSLPLSLEVTSTVVNYDDTSKYEAKFFHGKEKVIQIKSPGAEFGLPSITLQAFSKDFKHFYFTPFTGGELSQFCKENEYKSLGVDTICKFGVTPSSSLKYIFRSEFESPECSPRAGLSFEFNNPNKNSEYRGIVLDVSVPSLDKEISEKFSNPPGCNPSPEFDAFVEKRLKEGLEEKNLTPKDQKTLEIAKEILNSIKVN